MTPSPAPGATFPAPLYAKWAEGYKRTTGNQLNFQAIGSGGGIKQIEAKTVDFGATDKPLTQAEQDQYGLYQFPTVIGGVVPAINIPGVPTGKLKLPGSVLADIFLGNITMWNDPAITKWNAALNLPPCRSPSSTVRTDRAPPSCSPRTCRSPTTNGRPRSAPTTPSNGRPAWAAPRTTASRPWSAARPAPSATSNTLTS